MWLSWLTFGNPSSEPYDKPNFERNPQKNSYLILTPLTIHNAFRGRERREADVGSSSKISVLCAWLPLLTSRLLGTLFFWTRCAKRQRRWNEIGVVLTSSRCLACRRALTKDFWTWMLLYEGYSTTNALSFEDNFIFVLPSVWGEQWGLKNRFGTFVPSLIS